ncbi:MAG: bifunctional diaminohydroxyphosphoribosylaminopyrimidine deaminase/5-amino-6-(5-phosphoribosylamino)uracil reductase RibD [Sulfurovum sp.]|nr:MAG: bifunctional diaminohydroxyphosphoribosylaminopyrimidine deaminase/5-amino-6-(5-phosphoribosylamino)uracil reductase RibD [Sulfurovum sp.]
MHDQFYMQLALDEAWKYQLLTYPNPAVGAVIVKNGAILAIEAHQRAGTSHAEVLALLGAYEKLSAKALDFDRFDAQKAHTFLRKLPKDFFQDCTIYVTLEPCAHEGKTPSCASLLAALSLNRVVIGIEDPIEGHGSGAKIVGNSSISPTINTGVLEEECKALIEPFMIWQERAFVLFKIAQTTNGRIGGGYLSCRESLTHVHRLRSLCDRLLIGGNTVRTDRPTLDSRFVPQGRAPDVTIYSAHERFDEKIPLFAVPQRRVCITDDLSFLQSPSFVLVEGGEGMLKALQAQIDWMLIYQTPKLSTHDLSYNIDMHLAFLHQAQSGIDMRIWSKNIGH